MLAMCCLPLCAQDIPTVVKENDASVFEIHVFDEAGLPLGTGTGFFIDAIGTALSNWHVFEGAAFAYALMVNDEVVEIEEITRYCVECDLVEFVVGESRSFNYNPVDINAELPEKGESLVVIGCPENYRNAVSSGIVAAMGEVGGQWMIQTEASISPGSSGSPVFNLEGEVFAIATQSDVSGQNLNFCTPIGTMDRLESVSDADQLASVRVPIYVFNQRCAYNNVLTLHSIAFHEQRTVAHFSFVNLSLMWGDEAYIFTDVGNPETSFKLSGSDGNEVLAVSSTIGTDVDNNTAMQLGETRIFTVQFPPIDPSQKMNLREGNGDWRFSNLDLLASKGMDVASLSDLEGIEALWMTMLTSADLAGAEDGDEFWYLNAAVKKIPESAFSYNLEGVLHYLMNDLGSAKWAFQAAAELAPGDGLPWFNLYAITPSEDSIDELNYLNKAIVADPGQVEFKLYRAGVHFGMGSWAACLEDYDAYILSDRNLNPVDYGKYGIAQIEIGNLDVGCQNVRYAFDYEAETGQNDDILYWLADVITTRCPKKWHK